VSRGRIIFAVVAVLVILVAVGAFALSAQSRVPQVTTAEVKKEDLTQKVTASGQTEADQEADVFPPTQGTLKMINVTDGQTVKAGQALATMDVRPLELQVEQARAAYLQAVAGRSGVTKQVPGHSVRLRPRSDAGGLGYG
jgi:multidrug efflux pump subunit AcrA (membrane-fusion protein)